MRTLAAQGKGWVKFEEQGAVPKVSIIIIFYNSERFFGEALESVLDQSFQDWELILIDDGSSDASTDMAKIFVATNPHRAKYFDHEGHVNRGTSASRNLGFSHARGEYVIRLDSDDVFKSVTALSEQVGLLDAHPDVALVYGPCEYWHSWNGTGTDKIFPLSFSEEEVAPPRLLALMIHPGGDEPISMMVRRNAIEAARGCDESIRDYGEDFSLAVKLTSAHRIYVSSQCWYRYRMHPGSYSHGIRAKGGQVEHERVLFDWLESYLRQHQVSDRGVWQAFRRRVWPVRYARWYRLREVLSLDLSWAARKLRAVCGNLLNTARGIPRASLEVIPPVSFVPGAGLCIVNVKWTVAPGQLVNVHVGAPDGVKFVERAVSSGCSTTNEWVTDRMVFFLQDASSSSPKSASATLATARARVVAPPESALTSS